jgi:hypothetical protein
MPIVRYVSKIRTQHKTNMNKHTTHHHLNHKHTFSNQQKDSLLKTYVSNIIPTKTSKRVDAVGIEPTTFHMCEDAKRLNAVLVQCSAEGEQLV